MPIPSDTSEYTLKTKTQQHHHVNQIGELTAGLRFLLSSLCLYSAKSDECVEVSTEAGVPCSSFFSEPVIGSVAAVGFEADVFGDGE